MRDRIYIQANGVTLNGILEGTLDGTPLIFINSLGSDLRCWDSVISILNQNKIDESHLIIRYDKRGHGLSDCPAPPYALRDHAEDLAGLIDAMGFDQVILVGISIGGMIAMDYTIRTPREELSALGPM